jgi:hypothetical protein
MVIDMNDSQLATLEQLRRFLDGAAPLRLSPLAEVADRYAHIARVVRRFGYTHLHRRDKHLVLRYLALTTGYGSAQIKRLVARAATGQRLRRRYRAPAHPFARRFAPADVKLLAAVDAACDTLSRPATAHLLRRAFTEYGDTRFERLATVSVAHLYNLRATDTYRRQRVVRTATRPSSNPMGTRRAPAPEGRAGFIRIDSVHQGDLDGARGSTISTPWTASPSGRSWPAASASARRICCRCSNGCWRPSPSPSAASTPTTARSTSTDG